MKLKLFSKVKFKSLNKIESAKALVDDAFSMFTKAANGIEEANKLLTEEKQSEIQTKQNLIDRIYEIDKKTNLIDKEVTANNELKKKLEDFLPNK